MASTVLYALAGLAFVAAVALWWTDRSERAGRPEVRDVDPGVARPGARPWAVAPRGPITAVKPVGRAGPPPLAPPPIPVPGPDRHALADRHRLVELCIDLGDRLTDEHSALAGRVYRGLAEVGVDVLEPDGSPFDRSAHDAVGVEPAPSPEYVRMIASTARAGFVDRGVLLRRPGVVVYTAQESRDDG